MSCLIKKLKTNVPAIGSHLQKIMNYHANKLDPVGGVIENYSHLHHELTKTY